MLAHERIHFIGIGGIGMSGIASILKKQGYRISGSDVKESAITQKLLSEGILVFLGHNPLHMGDAKIVVYSSAIREDNPELVAARNRGMVVMRRAQALAELMQEKTCIAVSGAHGKTTTTALTSHVLLQSGFYPTVAIGGILRNLEDNCCVGESEFFVAEADESDGTFLYYMPDYPIITNIDREHLDYYHSWQEILDAYTQFISHTKDKGCLFCCGDDPAIRQITAGYKGRIVYFGLSSHNDYHPQDIRLNGFSSQFSCCHKDKILGKITLPLAGEHNISNSLAVIALGKELGIADEDIVSALSTFKGTQRRFQLKAEHNGIKIIDDYGHHPTEIRATLQAAKNVASQRLIVVFEPHRYSRTQFLMDEFVDSFQLADCVVLTDIYAASENPIEGVSSEALYKRIKLKFPSVNVVYLAKEKIVAYVLDMLKPGDVVLTVGAGDIGKLSDELVHRITCENTL